MYNEWANLQVLCMVTNGEISGWYKWSSVWVLIKYNTIGWVRICAWVAKRKGKNGGQGIEGYIGCMKGFELHPRDAMLALKEYWLTQNIDQTWDINSYQSFWSWGHFPLAPCLMQNHVIPAVPPSCQSQCRRARATAPLPSLQTQARRKAWLPGQIAAFFFQVSTEPCEAQETTLFQALKCSVLQMPFITLKLTPTELCFAFSWTHIHSSLFLPRGLLVYLSWGFCFFVYFPLTLVLLGNGER